MYLQFYFNSGLIGRSWAMLFAAADYDVVVYDIDDNQLTGAMKEIRTQISLLESQKLLRGSLSADQQYKNIKTTKSLEDCVSGAGYIQASDLSLCL